MRIESEIGWDRVERWKRPANWLAGLLESILLFAKEIPHKTTVPEREERRE